MKIGVICPSEIAFRRFMPALQKSESLEYAGIAVANQEEWGGTYTDQIKRSELEKAQNFVNNYGGKIYHSYNELIEDENIQAVYLPLPPALHYKWGKRVLENGKHLFLEKPSTTSAQHTEELIDLAKKKKLALHENYMFIFHEQLSVIDEIVKNGEIGNVRLYRIAFGFPQRAKNDFRYNKKLGGGALLDCGGYTIKLARKLLGETAKLAYSNLNYTPDFDVDIYGSAAFVNHEGATAQISFGMDNDYKCDLEIWGSTGSLFTGRIFTAPAGFVPEVQIKKNNSIEKRVLPEDDTFVKSIHRFYECIINNEIRELNYAELLSQAKMVDEIKEKE